MLFTVYATSSADELEHALNEDLSALKLANYALTAAIRNFHLGPCKIEKSKIAKLCHNKGLPKPFIKI